MTNRERVQLLFGPYQAPPLKRGDRATCLFRDCEVVVTAWTGARVPWPRCRALDNYRGGGWGLPVDEELAGAVRHKAAAGAGARDANRHCAEIAKGRIGGALPWPR